ncbi:hypothetical protein KTN05_02445 [Paracoccus sp. Z118]|uniref:hypothetical protein n=1 Tax=Paracoccus sp. Z118 TaxID=2851017 RepID=UPI001C2C09C2|nr:hypothetical protein [Paracoccus sp. Z118]MBV0890709.1 hypothetical protein [Paracoccus sp. Z118]
MERPLDPAEGSASRWTAETGGQVLPILHSTWWNLASGDYLDPMRDVLVDGPAYDDYVARLRSGDRVIMQKDADPVTLAPAGIEGVFRFSNLDVRPDGSIRLVLGERVADANP